MNHADLKKIAEVFVMFASREGYSVAAIEAAVEASLVTLRNKEEKEYLQEYASNLTYEPAEDLLTHAMAEVWESDDVDQLTEALKIKFPKHHKSIVKLIDIAGDCSNEREDMRNGPSKEFEELYDEAINKLKKLPWKKV